MSTAVVEPTSHERALRRRRRREALTGGAFIAPFVLLFAGVFLAPIVLSIKEAFYRERPVEGGLYGGGGTVSTFVGLDNFTEVLATPGDQVQAGAALIRLEDEDD